MKVEAVVTIEFLTPAFIGGADPHGPSEFNEKALKGVLRFWWRAFCADPNGNNTQLLEEESKIFGGQKSKSKFSLLISIRNEKLVERKNLDEYFKSIKDYLGIKYLLYSKILRDQVIKKDYFESKSFIEPNSSYDIRIIADNEQTMQTVLTSLWLLENFGGLGARSRRGAGSFKITRIEGICLERFNNVPKFLFNSGIKDVNKIQEFLNQGLGKIKPQNNSLPKYTAYSPTGNNSYFKVKVTKSSKWEEAMNELGNIYSKFRSFTRNPYNTQASSLHKFAVSGNTSNSNETPGIEQNPPTKTAFGLPIIYNFKDQLAIKDKSKRFSVEAKPFVVAINESEKSLERRASPLFFKIGEINKSFYIVALAMWAEFLPNEAGIGLVRKQGKSFISSSKANQPSKMDIDNFMEIILRGG